MQNVSTLADAGTLDRHEPPIPTVTESASPNTSPLNPQSAANAKEYNRIKIFIGLAAIIEFMFHSHPSIDKRIRLVDAIPLMGANGS